MRKLLLVALLLASGAALAQDDPKRPEKLVELAFKFRRDGQLDAAAAALDEAIKDFPEKAPERRAAIRDAYDVAWVESKFERCGRLAHGVDAVLEARALVLADKAAPALEAARAAKDPLAEGIALRGLKKTDEALAAFARAGAPGQLEKAELLLSVGRFADAAKEFEAAGDLFSKARALERAGAPADWKQASDDASRKLVPLGTRTAEASLGVSGSSGGVARERARFALAELQDQLSRAYERSSVALEKTNDRAKAAQHAETALKVSEDCRKNYTDGGKDRFGDAKVKQLGLVAREDELRARIKALRR